MHKIRLIPQRISVAVANSVYWFQTTKFYSRRIEISAILVNFTWVKSGSIGLDLGIYFKTGWNPPPHTPSSLASPSSPMEVAIINLIIFIQLSNWNSFGSRPSFFSDYSHLSRSHIQPSSSLSLLQTVRSFSPSSWFSHPTHFDISGNLLWSYSHDIELIAKMIFSQILGFSH